MNDRMTRKTLVDLAVASLEQRVSEVFVQCLWVLDPKMEASIAQARSVATSLKILGHPSPQNRLANATAFSAPVRPAVSAGLD